MKKLWIRWAVLVVIIGIVGVVFVQLGEWQLHRLDSRRARNATVVANQNQPIKAWTEVFDSTIEESEQWQRVSVTGTYLPQHQLEVRYRTVGDQPGSQWVVPLQTADGQTVLVDRGFSPRADGQVRPAAAPPSGEVTVTGFARRNERGKDNAIMPVEASVRLINSPAISGVIGLPLADGYIQLISSTPADSLAPVGTPELGEGPHFSYAMQWFLFTLVAVVGALFLVRADLRDRRQRRERAAAAREKLAARGRATDVESAAE